MNTGYKPQFWLQPHDPKYCSKNTFLKYYPQRVMLSMTSRCNLCCWHCEKAVHPCIEEEMPQELMEYIVKNIVAHCHYLRIGGQEIGEPLLYKNFNYFFEILDRKKNPALKEIALVTNLTLLDKEKARIIADNIDVLEVSIEGTHEVYSRIRHFPWEKIVENIKLIAEHRKTNGSNKPFIVLPICTMLNNLENLTNVFALKDVGVDTIVFREFTAWAQEKNNECLWQDTQKTFSYIRKFEEKAAQTGMPIVINFKDRYDPEKKKNLAGAKSGELRDCYLPWTCISIDSKRNISCCCRDLALAQLKTDREEFSTLWNTKKFRSLRRRVNSKKPYFDCLDCELKMEHCTAETIEALKNRYIRYALRRIAGRYAITRALSRLSRRLHV